MSLMTRSSRVLNGTGNADPNLSSNSLRWFSTHGSKTSTSAVQILRSSSRSLSSIAYSAETSSISVSNPEAFLAWSERGAALASNSGKNNEHTRESLTGRTPKCERGRRAGAIFPPTQPPWDFDPNTAAIEPTVTGHFANNLGMASRNPLPV